MRVNIFLKKLLSYLFCLTILQSCTSISQNNRGPDSHLDADLHSIQKRIRAFGYPMSEKTIKNISKIKRELTPDFTSSRSKIIKREKSIKCEMQKIQIYYKDDKKEKSFEAILKRPTVRFSKLWFPDRKKFPLVVIQPTLAGPTILEKNIAYDLCRYGFATIVPTETILDLPKKLPDFKAYDRNMRIEMIRAQRMIDYIETRKDIDHLNVGLIGFSRGAIAGSLLLGLDKRIKYAYLGGGGAGLGQIIANSKTAKGIEDNQKHMKAAGQDQSEYERSLIKNVEYDPLLFSHFVDRGKVKLMLIKNDESVSTHNQELLRKSFNYPETTFIDKGHVGSIVRLVFLHKKDYIDFFISKIKD